MKQINLQDSFLNQVRKENVPVTVHLVNGFQIKGNVRGFDNFTVIIDSMVSAKVRLRRKQSSNILRPTFDTPTTASRSPSLGEGGKALTPLSAARPSRRPSRPFPP